MADRSLSNSDQPLRGVVISLQHVNVPSTNLQRSRQFYCEVLGLDELPRPTFDVRGIWLAAGRGQSVHITESESADSNSINHFALQVIDLDIVLSRLGRIGIECRLGTPVVGAGRQAYLVDPDGNVIELIEPTNG